MGASWGQWKGWNPDIIAAPERINYWLDILDNGGQLGDYSIKKIGKRTHVEQATTVNQIFQVFIPDIVWIENPGTPEKLKPLIKE